MCGDNTTFTKSTEQKLKVGLLEQGLGGTLWVAGIGDDDVELVLALGEELEAVSDDGGDGRVLEADGHSREVLLGQADHSLLNI